ncbi:MAG: YneF family protein [Acetilactobacillus jinshanensis]
MSWFWILLIILFFLAGIVVGFYAARKYMKTYLKNNPPINETQLSLMMSQMGRRPSKKKLRQMMNTMKNHQNY